MSLRGRTDRPEPTSTVMPVILVACGKTNLAIPAGIIHGIVESAEAIRARIVSLLGATCRVADLGGRFGLEISRPTREARIVLCGEHRARQAWRVERVWGLLDVKTRAIVPLPPHFGGPERGWFTGLFLFRESVALMVNPSWLLNDSVEVSEEHQPSVEWAPEEPVVLEPSEIIAAVPVSVETQAAVVAEEVTPELVAAAEAHPVRTRSVRPKVGDTADAAMLDTLENLVLEESKDAEDGEVPWA